MTRKERENGIESNETRRENPKWPLAADALGAANKQTKKNLAKKSETQWPTHTLTPIND